MSTTITTRHLLTFDLNPACGQWPSRGDTILTPTVDNVTCDACRTSDTYTAAVISGWELDMFRGYPPGDYCTDCGLTHQHWPGCPRDRRLVPTGGT